MLTGCLIRAGARLAAGWFVTGWLVLLVMAERNGTAQRKKCVDPGRMSELVRDESRHQYQ